MQGLTRFAAGCPNPFCNSGNQGSLCKKSGKTGERESNSANPEWADLQKTLRINGIIFPETAMNEPLLKLDNHLFMYNSLFPLVKPPMTGAQRILLLPRYDTALRNN
jgi:hypothetical protein